MFAAQRKSKSNFSRQDKLASVAARVADAWPPVVEALDRRLLLSADQVFVTSPSNGTIAEYGAATKPNLVPSLDAPYGIAASGSDLFVVNNNNGTIGEYTTSGATVHASLISGLNNPFYIAADSTNLYVGINGNLLTGNSSIAKYSLSGASEGTIVSGITDPVGVAVSGSDLFVLDIDPSDLGTYRLSEYTTAGTQVNLNLVTGLNQPNGLAISGSDIYITNDNGTISEYTTGGTKLNADLFSTASTPYGIATDGSDLYVVSVGSGAVGTLGEYTMSGGTVDANLATNLPDVVGVAVAQNTSSNSGPVITTNPASQSVAIGKTVTFSAAATGTPTPTVQWEDSIDGGKSFSDIIGATSTSYQFTVTAADNGFEYRAVFSNGVGSPATTTAATLTATASTPNGSPPVAEAFYGALVNDSSSLTHYKFSITFTDTKGVLLSSVSGRPIYVSGPNGYFVYARPTSLSPDTNGSPIVGGYRIYPPATNWTASDNGVYTIWLRKNRVEDVDGNFTPGEALGTFTVDMVTESPFAVESPAVSSKATAAASDASSNWLDSGASVLA